MQGYQLTFFTQQDRRHGAQPLAQWLLEEARRLGLRGATMTAASEGFGRHGHIHSAHFFELSDQPVAVSMAVTGDEADQLFQRLADEQIHVFYVKTPIEFGVSGQP